MDTIVARLRASSSSSSSSMDGTAGSSQPAALMVSGLHGSAHSNVEHLGPSSCV
jgi:hypothetical protein